MIDLHCHLLPSIDDGASDLATTLEMARMQVAGGVHTVACTPHILPGLYKNTGPQIRQAVEALRKDLALAGIPLTIVTGADVHLVPDLVPMIRDGQVLTLADTRYILIEPPHHVCPPRFEEVLFDLVVQGLVPVITHPERLTWVADQYEMLPRLVASGVWMQITSGSLTGAFGSGCRRLAERMLDDSLVHILASDAHDPRRRPPDLWLAAEIAALRIGEAEARRLVVERPQAMLDDIDPRHVASPEPLRNVIPATVSNHGGRPRHGKQANARSADDRAPTGPPHHEKHDASGLRGMVGRLRRYFS